MRAVLNNENQMKNIILFVLFYFSNSWTPLMAQWSQVPHPAGGSVYCMTASGGTVFAGTDQGVVIRSSDNGTTWTLIPIGLSKSRISTLAVTDSYLFAGTEDDGLFRSSDNGASWKAVNTGFESKYIQSVIASGTDMFAGTYLGVFHSTDYGEHWVLISSYYFDASSLVVSGTHLYASSGWEGVFRFTQNGTNWTTVPAGFARTGVGAFAVMGTDLLAETGVGVFRFSGNDTTWTSISTGLPKLTITALAVSGTNMYIGTQYGGIYRSADKGNSWSEINVGLTSATVLSFAVSGNNLFAGTNLGIFISTDNGSRWNAVNTGLTKTGNVGVYAFASSDSNFYAGVWGEGVWRSTDKGTSWTSINFGLTKFSIRALIVSGSTLFAGTEDGVFRSTDHAATWTPANTGLAEPGAYITAYCFALSGPYLFVGTYQGLFRSADNGDSWTAVKTGRVRSLVVSGTTLFANISADPQGGVIRSTDNGSSWSQVNTGITDKWVPATDVVPVYDLAVSGKTIYAATWSNVFHSTDNGTSWTCSSQTSFYEIQKMIAIDSVIIVGTWDQGMYLSADTGTSWRMINAGLSESQINALGTCGPYLFAGTYGAGIWRRQIHDMVTEVQTIRTQIPDRVALSENYPNPFNPSTTISFSLPSRSFVSLKIFDVMGREVATLASEEMPAGNYSRQWNATGMSSGLYFYRLQAGAFVQTKKLLLLR
jgi:photosystem II stability/assembly factor-like uncharacterized protein